MLWFHVFRLFKTSFILPWKNQFLELLIILQNYLQSLTTFPTILIVSSTIWIAGRTELQFELYWCILDFKKYLILFLSIFTCHCLFTLIWNSLKFRPWEQRTTFLAILAWGESSFSDYKLKKIFWKHETFYEKKNFFNYF